MTAELRERLADALTRAAGGSSDFDLNPQVRPAAERKLRPAGVLIGIEPGAQGAGAPQVILTKRASHLRHHPGQIAFPGGKLEPEDGGPVDAALREAEEEIGLPASHVEVLGTFPPHETVTVFTVTPVLALVRPGFAERPELGEVEEIFRVPLNLVLDPANYRIEGRRWQGVRRRYYVLPYGPYYIWGATARMLRGLAEWIARLTADWLASPGARKVTGLLVDGGHQALFVGGCVRNALLGLPPGDLDLATDATPARVMALARAAGVKAVPTGIDHGTVTLVPGEEALEVTTFRADVETDGRHAIVRFSTDIVEDAARRDFTMNALYAASDGRVLDPLGGLPDLRAGRVRFIGEPAARLAEDGLRILRFFRFTAWYGDPAQGIDAEGLAACAAAGDLVGGLSRERIGKEMLRLLAAPDPAPALASMQMAGLLARVLPGASALTLASLVHAEAALGLAPDAPRRLAALGGEAPFERLRLSKAIAAQTARLAQAAASGQPPAELGYRLGAEEGASVLALRGAAPEDLADLRRGAAARFPVEARDLRPRFEGAALGQQLRALEARWLASGLSLTRDELLDVRG